MAQVVQIRLWFGRHNSSTAVFAPDPPSREGKKTIMSLPPYKSFEKPPTRRNHAPASTEDSRRTNKLFNHSRTIRIGRSRSKRHGQICVLLRRRWLFL